VTSRTFGGSGVTPNAAELSYAVAGGDWTIAGGGTGETFTLAALFNTVEITDYGAAFPGATDVVCSQGIPSAPPTTNSRGDKFAETASTATT